MSFMVLKNPFTSDPSVFNIVDLFSSGLVPKSSENCGY